MNNGFLINKNPSNGTYWVRLLFFVLIFLPPQAWCQVSYWDYVGLKAVSRYIVKNYPPEQYLYVGVGASPVGVMAYLELSEGRSSIAHLPMTNVRSLYIESRREYVESDNFNAVLKKHFQQFLPDSLIKGRKILLIDFALGGGSITFVRDKLRFYFSQRDRQTGVESLALVRNAEVESKLIESGHDVYRLGRRLRARMLTQSFDAYRKFEKFSPQLVQNPNDYQPPKEIFVPWTIDEYQQSLRKGPIGPLSYEHLLFEISGFMNRKVFDSRFFKSFLRSQNLPGMQCREIFLAIE